jgi:hypothetical protein
VVKLHRFNEKFIGARKNYTFGRQGRWTTSLFYFCAGTAISRYRSQFIEVPLYSKLAQLVSDAAFVDRKIKFRIPARTGLALKHLRNQLAVVLNERLRNKPITESQERWMDLVFIVLGKLRPELDSTAQNVVLDVVRH